MPVTIVIVSLLVKTGLAYLLIFGHAGCRRWARWAWLLRSS